MAKTRLIAILFLVAGILISCKTYRYIDIQILKPAESQAIKSEKLFIISPNKFLLDTVYKKDSTFYLSFLTQFGSELKNKLSESPLHDNTDIITTSKSNFIESYYNKMDYNQRKNAVICSLNSIMVNDTSYVVYYDWVAHYEYRLIYFLKLSFSKASTLDLTSTLYITDTIYWDRQINSYFFDLNKIEKRQLLKNIGLIKLAAERTAFKIAPFWITAERMLYCYANKPMKSAYIYYCNDQLDLAIEKWKYVYENGTKNLASMAAYNIAVSYEVLDNLENAEQWINKSVEKRPDPNVLKYQKIIKHRMAERNKIDTQLMN